MMKGGGCNKRDRRFLTIDRLSLKNEYCSDNIIEMTAVLEVLRSSMDGQYETIRGLGLSGWVLVVLLNKDKGKAFKSCCIVTPICMTSHNGLNIYFVVLFEM